MDFLSLVTCIVLKAITLTNGYVLLAANIDDFQTIAKKFGSQKFLDELVQLANKPDFEKYKPSNHRDKVRQDDTIQGSPIVRQREPKLHLKETGTLIDFEELVEKVRQRLEKEFEIKSYKEDDLKTRPVTEITEYTRNTRTTKRDTYYNQHVRDNVEPLKGDEIQYDDVNPINNIEESDVPIKETDLAKVDSYDDFVTPARDASVETKENRFKVKNNKVEVRPTVTYHSKRFKHRSKTNKDGENSNEIKAKTDRLFYEEIHDGDKKSGTGIPTRQTYKMVSPNYYVSLPTVAERYDFNEPLPERDRERENVKYIRKSPARVNKKIPRL